MVSNAAPASAIPARASTLMSYLRFWPIFAGRSDSRTRAQLREHRLARDLVRRPRVVVPEGDVGGVPGHDGERHPHQLRPHVVEARGLGVEGDLRGGAQALDPGVEGGFVEHRLVLGLQGLGRRLAVRAEQLPEPGLELQLPVEGLQRLHVRLAERQIEGTGIEGHVAADRHQLLRERDAVDARPQVLPHLALDLAGMGDEGVERAVLRQPLRRGLRPHLRDPGDVVHRIADQRQVIDDGLRRHAELGLHPGRVEDRPVHGVDHGDPIVHELGHVLVPGGDQHVEPRLLAPLGEGADDVVGLHPRHLQHREAERAHQRVDRLDLGAQLPGHGGAVRLVFGIQIVAEGPAPGVEDHRRELGRHLRFEPLQHVGHAVDGSGGPSLGVG